MRPMHIVGAPWHDPATKQRRCTNPHQSEDRGAALTDKSIVQTSRHADLSKS
jgi:hypothetical protein